MLCGAARLILESSVRPLFGEICRGCDSAVVCLCVDRGSALNPRKELSRHAHHLDARQGLRRTPSVPRQTADGYLWLGTDESRTVRWLEFVIFSKDNGDLPSNSITPSRPARWQSLDRHCERPHPLRKQASFTTYTIKDGLPDNAIPPSAGTIRGTVWSVRELSSAAFRPAGSRISSPARTSHRGDSLRLRRPRHNIWIAGSAV